MDRCWAMTRAWNEEKLIGYWVRHYRTFCERVIVYIDQDTDDKTATHAIVEGAETVYVSSVGLDDLAFVTFAQERYLWARGWAQWVCWTDADEIVYAPDMGVRLDALRAQGVTVPTVQGYSMVADAPPTGTGQIYEEITRGFSSSEYSKVCIFDPELDVQWTPGKHTATVRGNVVHDEGSDPLKLLHYRYLGEQWCRERHARNWARMPEVQRRASYGRETAGDWDGPYSIAWYAQQSRQAYEVIA